MPSFVYKTRIIDICKITLSTIIYFLASRRLRDLIRQPFDLYRAGVIDEYFMGMSNQVAQAMDDSVTQEVSLQFSIVNSAVYGRRQYRTQ